MEDEQWHLFFSEYSTCLCHKDRSGTKKHSNCGEFGFLEESK